MLKDVKTSFDTMKGFYEDTKPADGPRLCVHVLSTGSWPSQLTRITTCNLPPEIIQQPTGIWSNGKGVIAFWAGPNLVVWARYAFWARGHVATNCRSKKNNAEQLSYKEIQQAVEIPTMELKRSVMVANMVSEPKKQETVQTVEKDRKQQIDALISDMAGSGTEAAHKEQDPGKLVMVQNLEVGRKPQIDASILKIMKANGIMNCNDLVREVTKQLQSKIRTNPAIIEGLNLLILESFVIFM
ncbi:cullin 3 [Tanacetum coccineum]|uniref:Cullin 3 n=1 Tax=Tanacetum coccineum TaxID=301880 RepID=A0ABQ5FLH6_9ASTR